MQMVALSIQLRKTETVINTIETSSRVLFNWFSDNFMKANSGKSHLLMSGTETTHANVDGSMIKSSQKEILLGINLDSELKFEDHVNFKKRRNIAKAFVESQFRYCPLIWMFHSRRLNDKINRIHERALRIIYKDKSSTFQELLEKDNSVSMHHKTYKSLQSKFTKSCMVFLHPF